MPLRILIADDHGVLRAGLRALLNAEPNLVVVGEAADGEQAILMAGELNPEIVLMDLSMPGNGGIEATRHLKEVQPQTRVLILTVHEDKALLQEALRAGAAGYILKRAVESELISAIQAVARGEMYVHPAMMRALFVELSPTMIAKDGPAEPLTAREIEVLRLIVKGHTNRQMAEILHLSTRTIETHRANLMDKLNLHSRVDLVRYAQEHSLLERPDGHQKSHKG